MTEPSQKKTFNLTSRGVLGSLVSSPDAQNAGTQDGAPALQKDNVEQGAQWISTSKIVPGTNQTRQYFSEESIQSLAESFKNQGFRGAINVRPGKEKGSYEIVAGERRWRAAKVAGLEKVRCIIDTYDDEEALEFGLVENLQREDLSKLEETEGILQLIEVKYGIPRDRAITIIRSEGHSDKQSRSDVAPSEEFQKIEGVLSAFNIELQTFRTKNLRTLQLPEDLKEAHLKNGLSYSSALEINKIKDETVRAALLEEVLTQGLSFRDIKKRVQENKEEPEQSKDVPKELSLLERCEVSLKKAKKANSFFEKTQKKKKLERILRELESLLDESEREP